MAARRRRVSMATSQQPCTITRKFIRCPITFTIIRKQIWGCRAQLWDAASVGTLHTHKHTQRPWSHLQAKLVVEVVDEVFDAAGKAEVEVLAGDVLEDGLSDRGEQLVLLAVVLLAPVHHGLQHQQQQHLQVVLGEQGMLRTTV